MKKGPKAEPSGTVAWMEEWAEGGTFGNGGADEDGPKAEPSGTVVRMEEGIMNWKWIGSRS